MARRKKYREEDFPCAGTVFLMPLDDGRLGACRVLRLGSEMGGLGALVAASPWIGTEAPSLNEPAIRETLILNHHAWRGEREVNWVFEPPPPTFRELGKFELSKADLETTRLSVSGWQSFAIQVFAQWQWDNDREGVAVEDAKSRDQDLAERKRQAEERERYLAKVTLEKLAGKDLFPGWDEYPPPAAHEATVKVMREFIEGLRKERALKERAARAHLKRCVLALNRLDEKHDGFIETVEREDLYGVLEEILAAAKVPQLLGAVEEWREW
jgi:hypothetical protein